MDNSLDIIYQDVKKNTRYGFWELDSRYRKEMYHFYAESYYQDEHALYQKREYDKVDMENKHYFYEAKMRILDTLGVCSKKQCHMLDIGTGEGYALAYFSGSGWEVIGIDLSEYGLLYHNPAMREHLILGDYEKVISNLHNEGKQFDFINADNVLEHVAKPEQFIDSIRKICHEETIVCITVPNDFSIIQQKAKEMNMIDSAFWVTVETSEHFSYFTIESLTKLWEDNGFRKIASLADWPIDFFLLNTNSNYRQNPEKGHDAHVACVNLENALYEQSMDKSIQLFQAMAEAGLGRDISVFFKPVNLINK